MKRILLSLLVLISFPICNAFAGSDFLLVLLQSSNDKKANARAYVKQARYLIEQNKYTDAKIKIEKALNLDPNNIETKQLLDSCLILKQSSSSPSSLPITTTSKEHPFSVSKDSLIFGASGGTDTITVSSSSDWVVLTKPDSWGHLTRNDNYLTLKVDKNTSASTRYDFFSIKSGSTELRIFICQRESAQFKKTVNSSNPGYGSNAISIKNSKGSITLYDHKTIAYGSYLGGSKNGKAYGLGKITYLKRHIIDERDPERRNAEEGDYIIGEFYDNKLVHGKWYDKDDNLKGSIIIGRQ